MTQWKKHFIKPALIISGFKSSKDEPVNLKRTHEESTENKPSDKMYNFVTLMLKGFFPPIDISTVKTDNIRRIVLFFYDKKNDNIELRHYTLKQEISGINKRIRNLVHAKKIPDLRKFDDISDYIIQNLEFKINKDLNESVDSEHTVNSNPNKPKRQMIVVKLHEIGPRLTLKLVKI